MAVWTAEEKQNFRNAHPCAMPKKQANHNYPHADVKGYFDAIFASDYPEYKGMVPIATKCGGSVRIITSVPAERIGEWVERCIYQSAKTIITERLKLPMQGLGTTKILLLTTLSM